MDSSPRLKQIAALRQVYQPQEQCLRRSIAWMYLNVQNVAGIDLVRSLVVIKAAANYFSNLCIIGHLFRSG
jgi:hypothetical protein